MKKTFVKNQLTGDYFAKYKGSNPVLNGKLLRAVLTGDLPTPMFCAKDYPEQSTPIPLNSFEYCTVDEVLAAFPQESKADLIEAAL